MKNAFLILVATAVLGLAPTVLSQQAGSPGDDPLVYSANENVLGMSIGEWSAAWWQWALTFTNDVSPIQDQTGQYCNSSQGGPMFFLAGSGGGIINRYCTIPAGKPLLIPLENVECSSLESGGFHVENPAQGRACVAPYIDVSPANLRTLKLTIDGQRVKGLGNFRVQSPYFYFTIPPSNNYLGTEDGTEGYAVADGFWVVAKPLRPGFHVIHFEAGVNWQNVTYHLTVTQ